jgi:hypothetical protein
MLTALMGRPMSQAGTMTVMHPQLMPALLGRAVGLSRRRGRRIAAVKKARKRVMVWGHSAVLGSP